MMSMNQVTFDTVVVGGGAAGCMCAYLLAKNGIKVMLIDPNYKLGRKLRITGKGRCNLTNNSDIKTVMDNIPGDGRFLYSALNTCPPQKVMQLFEDLGVPLKTERGNRVFPVSDNANDIADALSSALHKYNVYIKQDKVKDIRCENGCVNLVVTESEEVQCVRCIVCTGGLSYPATGSTGDGYKFAKRMGHHIVECRPSLVPLESNDDACKELQGLSLKNVTVKIYENDKIIFKDQGEMLFTHFGVSGPLILSGSAHMRNVGSARYRLSIDLKPALDNSTLDKRLLRDFKKYSNKTIHNGLKDILPRSMISVILKKADIDPEQQINNLTREQRQHLIDCMKNFLIDIKGTRPYKEAIVTAGGIDTKEVNPRTMQSKIIEGLYFAGEVLNLDAYTGGYNLQIAWSTAYIAAKSIISEENKYE